MEQTRRMTNGSDPAVMTVKNPLRMTRWSEMGLAGQPSSCRGVYEVEDGRICRGSAGRGTDGVEGGRANGSVYTVVRERRWRGARVERGG